MNQTKEQEIHHPWCNYYLNPRKGCKMCEKFYKFYPCNEKTSQEMLDTYFQDNECVNPKIKRKNVND